MFVFRHSNETGLSPKIPISTSVSLVLAEADNVSSTVYHKGCSSLDTLRVGDPSLPNSRASSIDVLPMVIMAFAKDKGSPKASNGSSGVSLNIDLRKVAIISTGRIGHLTGSGFTNTSVSYFSRTFLDHIGDGPIPYKVLQNGCIPAPYIYIYIY